MLLLTTKHAARLWTGDTTTLEHILEVAQNGLVSEHLAHQLEFFSTSYEVFLEHICKVLTRILGLCLPEGVLDLFNRLLNDSSGSLLTLAFFGVWPLLNPSDLNLLFKKVAAHELVEFRKSRTSCLFVKATGQFKVSVGVDRIKIISGLGM